MSRASTSISLPETLVASWTRSREHGLRPNEPLNGGALARSELGDRLDENQRLMTFAQPVMEGLYRQLASTSSTVLLADHAGTILSSIGHTDFLERANRVALRPGVSWSEASMGTNAIGTALQANKTVSVQGAQHYLDRNRVLSCIATPILAPMGGMLGVLDISSDARASLTHARALLRTTAELIEHRLVENLDRRYLTLHFCAHLDGLNDPLHAVMAFDESGRVMASNRKARALLNLKGDLARVSFESHFLTPWTEVLDWAAHTPDAPFPIRALGSDRFVARGRLHRRHPPSRAGAKATPKPAESRLALLDLGDPAMARIVSILHDRSTVRTPLLIEGEMGTGKAFLVRAFHADHCASPDAPIVGVDCSTLGHGTEGEEELDIAWAQAANGILFLVDFDSLPTSAQMRLFEANDGTRARIVGTTRQALIELQRAGRLDLRNFDVNGGRILSMPPLRQRTDFTALVHQFLGELAPDKTIQIRADALALLSRHRWPGNVRELRNQLRVILALLGDEADLIDPSAIPEGLFDSVIDPTR